MQVAVGAARFRRYARGALEPVEQALPPQINAAGPMGRAGVFGALAVRRPVGVVTCITSYNNPWANPAGKVAPALAMGNTVVVKPAPQDPLSVYRMAEALEEAGVPPGVVNVVTGSAPAVGEAAVGSPDVDMVSFTGSTQVGAAHRRGLRAGHEAAADGARRQGRGPRLRRRGPGRGRDRHRHDLLLLQRADLHGTDPGARAARHPRPAGRETRGLRRASEDRRP